MSRSCRGMHVAMLSNSHRRSVNPGLPARLLAGIFPTMLLMSGPGLTLGQDYPNKPIRIVTGTVGGSSDFAARLIAAGLTAALRQQVIVDNRSAGVIPGTIVSKAQPDGYTLLVAGGTFSIGSLLQKTPYEPMRDFAPVTLAVTAPNILVVHPSVPVKSVRDLIVLAKEKPGILNCSTGATGASSHLALELFKSMAGVNISRIPYKGAGPAVNDLISGQVQLTFATSSVAPHVKSGKLIALAVTSAQPSALAPGLPTVAASGLAGYESASMSGLFAPAGTPDPIISSLNRESVRVLSQTEVREKFLNTGAEVVASSSVEFAARLKSEMSRLGKVIRDANIRAE